MIEVKTKLGKTEVTVSGSIPMLCTDTTQIVRAIYHAIRERDSKDADGYKAIMEKNLCKLAFKGDEETPEIDGIIEALEGLLKIIKD
ncbi:MAG: hypothetical protein IJ089_10050 [Clostridia bacterium]|nr:hypothetical protein [Clostridia bacterium]